RDPGSRGYHDRPGALRLGSVLDRARLAAEAERRIDQADVAIGLGKVAQHPPSERIKLLRQQAHVIAARKQAIEQSTRFRATALQDVIVDEPEAACEKRAFARRQAVARVLAFVAQEKLAADQQALLDCAQRPTDPRIVGRKEPDDRDQQQAGIELFGAVGLDEAAELAIEAALAHFRLDLIGDLAPPRRRFAEG